MKICKYCQGVQSDEQLLKIMKSIRIRRYSSVPGLALELDVLPSSHGPRKTIIVVKEE